MLSKQLDVVDLPIEWT